jgi:hypothetical protein
MALHLLQDLVRVCSLIALHLICNARNPTLMNPQNSSNSRGTVPPLVMGIVSSKFLQYETSRYARLGLLSITRVQ